MIDYGRLQISAEGSNWVATWTRHRMPYLSEAPYDWSFLFQYRVTAGTKEETQKDIDDVTQGLAATMPAHDTRQLLTRVECEVNQHWYGHVIVRGFIPGAKP